MLIYSKNIKNNDQTKVDFQVDCGALYQPQLHDIGLVCKMNKPLPYKNLSLVGYMTVGLFKTSKRISTEAAAPEAVPHQQAPSSKAAQEADAEKRRKEAAAPEASRPEAVPHQQAPSSKAEDAANAAEDSAKNAEQAGPSTEQAKQARAQATAARTQAEKAKYLAQKAAEAVADVANVLIAQASSASSSSSASSRAVVVASAKALTEKAALENAATAEKAAKKALENAAAAEENAAAAQQLAKEDAAAKEKENLRASNQQQATELTTQINAIKNELFDLKQNKQADSNKWQKIQTLDSLLKEKNEELARSNQSYQDAILEIDRRLEQTKVEQYQADTRNVLQDLHNKEENSTKAVIKLRSKALVELML